MLCGLGLDVIEISRIRRTLRTFKGRFKERVFTPAEIAYCQSQGRPSLAYAARWAAKEAGYKALGTDTRAGITWTDLEVTHAPHGGPLLVLHGPARARWEALGSPAIHLSLSHTRSTAAAVVILERRDGVS